MKAGFGKVDITPRLGVEMGGFGPYLHRVAKDVRDPLYATALVVTDGHDTWVLISCDLIGIMAPTVVEARKRISQATGLAGRQIMVHCTHTHSGPATAYNIGWGEPDAPYMERLPMLIARAATEALGNLKEAEFSYAPAPAEHIAYNRGLERRPNFEDALNENWQPKYPEATDREAHVIRVESEGKMSGFLSSFSCHPVVCCEATHSLHGDFVAVATHLVEKEHPSCIGMFLQGSHGDINTAICHEPQDRSMQGLDVIAGRYAKAIRAGLAQGKKIRPVPLGAVLELVTFKRADLTEEELETYIALCREHVLNPSDGKTDEEREREIRGFMVHLAGTRKIMANLKARGTHEEAIDMQGFRLGDLIMIGTPFELARHVKERLRQEAGHEPLLMLSTTNDTAGYTQKTFSDGNYGTIMCGICPFTSKMEDEIVDTSLRLIKQLQTQKVHSEKI